MDIFSLIENKKKGIDLTKNLESDNSTGNSNPIKKFFTDVRL